MVVETDVSKELEVLRGDLGKLRHDVAEWMETVRYTMGSRMQAARAGASEEAARGMEGEGLEWFRSHSYPALGIAAVGFIAGRFPKLRRMAARLIGQDISGKT